ncbi:IclR family transcriptional regulator [Pseudodesulfovibrio tunisiensis]|uniref:IclR family transcriptional regulator n=1 Tax=Pseudodesulfovibrio tunisiensis TaxID=463192 RepID=UPI001FB37B3A|nr:IclR family transcriptional regulator [Pseudodesulfovibrio tunisiensis]
MSESEKKYYTIGAIVKACSVVEMLSTRKSWDLSGLCRAVGLPKTTVHRILLTLEDLGFVLQEQERGEYALSYKIFSLGSRVVNHSNIVDFARSHCRDLLRKVNETVNLCVVSGTDMLIIDKQVATQSLRQDSLVGSSYPLFHSASGKVVLAFLEDDEREKLLARIKRENFEVTEQDVEALRQESLEIRKTGLGHDYEEVYQGVRCIAAPIFDFQDRIIATLSVSVPTIRLDDKSRVRIERELLIAAERISSRVGSFHPLFRLVERRVEG